MKLSKVSIYLLGALVLLGITCILVNKNYQKAKEDQVVIAYDSVIEIKEKMFIAQVNDVYLNSEDYLGKTIQLEGLFKKEQYDDQGKAYCFVLRYGPGCCGNDGNAGFEVAWKETEKPLPNVDDWVQATGVLTQYEEDGSTYLYIALSDIKVLDKRGNEFVAQ